ncbi:hypothetical protein ACLKA6_007000 [Drosophila palustris]
MLPCCQLQLKSSCNGLFLFSKYSAVTQGLEGATGNCMQIRMKGKQANRVVPYYRTLLIPRQRLAAMFTAQGLAKYPVAMSPCSLEAICCHHFRPLQPLYKLSCQQF